MGPQQTPVAYFSMEIALESDIPTYSGGLGVLAGDTLRAAADLEFPMVGVTLVYRAGHFRQHLDEHGNQTEEPERWDPGDRLPAVSAQASITLEGRRVRIRAWPYLIRGASGFGIPVYLLDTDDSSNAPEHRGLTDHLYGGDERYRLCQEAILGIGGVRLLHAVGYTQIQTYHMNEGHSALLGLGLLSHQETDFDAARAQVKKRCVFTTHTPVSAGHDRFGMDVVRRIAGDDVAEQITHIGGCEDGKLNMTRLALKCSRFANAVAARHAQISRSMFPEHSIVGITNGVHAGTWVAAPFQKLFDRYIPGWHRQVQSLRHAVTIPVPDIAQAHRLAKERLIETVTRKVGVNLNPDVLTLGFARRATSYKRANLILSQPDRLREIASKHPLQVIFAGKAHPKDEGGKELIRAIFRNASELKDMVTIVYLPNYDMALAHELCAGVDLWVNTPQRPKEASGTSGMKAALNGVPSLSILDGWWIEGHVEGVTGWSIGESWEPQSSDGDDADALYYKLDRIARLFHTDQDGYTAIGRNAISLNGAHFNAQRMLEQYIRSAYIVPAD